MENPYSHSVVHEFSILYTSRVSQKNKCWFDGTLRYFEVNGKLEVSNEEGSVISIDFLNKPPNVVLQTVLVPEKVLKLSNNALLLEIIAHTNDYERDVSCINNRSLLNAVTKRTEFADLECKESLNAVANKKSSMKPSGTFDNYKVNILESLPMKPSETLVNNSASAVLNKDILQNTKGASPDDSTPPSLKLKKPVYRNQLSRRRKGANDNSLEAANNNSALSSTSKVTKKRNTIHLPRVPVGSSQYFQYLNKS